MSETFTLVTDGACSGNGTDDARGGWAAILTAPDGAETVLTGGEYPTTNNRMELMGALEGLRGRARGLARCELVTDSSYVANAISKGWLAGWQRKGWRTASKQPVANRDLWERMILELARHRSVRPVLVRGHAGHEANERADRLAATPPATPSRAARAASPPAPPPRRPGLATRSSSASTSEPAPHAGRRARGDRGLRRRPPRRWRAGRSPCWRAARRCEALRAGPAALTDDGAERAVRAADGRGPARRRRPSTLALVCVKSFDTAAAARALRPGPRPGRRGPLAPERRRQPGARSPARARGAAVGGVAVYLGCQRLAPDHVVRRPSRDPSTGRLRDLLAGGGAGPAGRGARRASGAAIGVPVRVDDDPAAALWTKLVANVALNTVTALGRARVGAVFAEPRAVELMLAPRARRSWPSPAPPGVPVAADAAGPTWPTPAGACPPAGGSSTLFDLEAGRRLEREALVGAVVREGARLGVDVPVSRACDALLRLQDPGGG